jgi:hypothetical protein
MTGMKKILNQKIITGLVLGVLTTLISYFVLFHKIATVYYNNDENFYLYQSKFFDLFISGDFKNPAWQEVNALNVPPVAKYYIGLAVKLHRLDQFLKSDLIVLDDSLTTWRFDWRSTGSWTGPFIITTPIRQAIAVSGIASTMALFCIGILIFDPIIALISAILFTANPLIISFSQRILTSMPTILFSLLTILFLTMWRTPQKSTGKTLGYALVVGLMLGLTVGAKQYGVFTGFTVVMYLAEIIVIEIAHSGKITDEGKRIINRTLLMALVSVCTSVIIFMALNPSFYPNPIQGYNNMVKYRNITITFQQQQFGPALYMVFDRLKYVIWTTFFPNVFAFFSTYQMIPQAFLFFTTGLILLFLKESRTIKTTHRPGPISILLWYFFGGFIGLLFSLPLAWEGYLLPIIPSAALIMGYAVMRIIQRIGHWMNHISHLQKSKVKL